MTIQVRSQYERPVESDWRKLITSILLWVPIFGAVVVTCRYVEQDVTWTVPTPGMSAIVRGIVTNHVVGHVSRQPCLRLVALSRQGKETPRVVRNSTIK